MIVGTPSNTDWSLQRYEILQDWNRKAEVHWGNAFLVTPDGQSNTGAWRRVWCCQLTSSCVRRDLSGSLVVFYVWIGWVVRNKCRTTNLLTCLYNFACAEFAKRWRKIPKVTSSQTCYDICPIALCTSYVLPAPFVGSHCGVHYAGWSCHGKAYYAPWHLGRGRMRKVTQGPNACRPLLRLVGHCGFLWFWISCWYILLVWWYGHAWNKKFRNLFLPIFNNILIINILMFKLNTSKKKQNYTLDIAFLAAVRCGVTSTFLGRSFDHMRSGGRIYARCGAEWNVPHLPNCLANCRISGKTHPLLLLMFGSANEIQWTS